LRSFRATGGRAGLIFGLICFDSRRFVRLTNFIVQRTFLPDFDAGGHCATWTRRSATAMVICPPDKGACSVVSLEFDLSTESESDAFFGAFFKFVEAAAVNDADAISVRSDPNGDHQVKVVTFEDACQADQFKTYWTQRRRWLGL
jgi:hypothetical protein